MNEKKLLEVQDLDVVFQTYGQKFHAVRGISFELHEGEILGIVGESGCGKSAAIKALTKLLPKHSCSIQGQVLLDGQDLASFSEKELQRVRGKEIGMIFQDPMTSLNPTLKIGTQIVEAVRQHDRAISKHDACARALEMLQLVGIPQPESRFNEYPHTMSGGQRQRAMIALALAAKPKVLCADEPTTALDVTIQAQILELLKSIQQKLATSIILITHDLSVIAGFCDRVLVMYAGKIVESGSVDDLFYRPSHPYTQRLLQSIPRLDLPPNRPLMPIEGTPPDLSCLPKGCSFCPRCPKAMNICVDQCPPLFEVGNQHHAACWLHDPRRNNHG